MHAAAIWGMEMTPVTTRWVVGPQPGQVGRYKTYVADAIDLNVDYDGGCAMLAYLVSLPYSPATDADKPLLGCSLASDVLQEMRSGLITDLARHWAATHLQPTSTQACLPE